MLCAHIPPAVPDLLFDTVARRMERGSQALLDAMQTTQPRYALFGHVHQPLASRIRIGRTECVNVGHFRATGDALRLGRSATRAVRTASQGRGTLRHGGQDHVEHRHRAAAGDVMAVIADFAAYPQWASGVRGPPRSVPERDGRAATVRFSDGRRGDQGQLRARLRVGRRHGVRWDLAEPGSVISEMSGGTCWPDRGDGTDGDLRARRGHQGADAGDAEAAGREDDHRHRAERAQVSGREPRESE